MRLDWGRASAEADELHVPWAAPRPPEAWRRAFADVVARYEREPRGQRWAEVEVFADMIVLLDFEDGGEMTAVVYFAAAAIEADRRLGCSALEYLRNHEPYR